MPTSLDDVSFRADPEAVVSMTTSRPASHGAIRATGRLLERELRERFVDADSPAIS